MLVCVLPEGGNPGSLGGRVCTPTTCRPSPKAIAPKQKYASYPQTFPKRDHEACCGVGKGLQLAKVSPERSTLRTSESPIMCKLLSTNPNAES